MMKHVSVQVMTMPFACSCSVRYILIYSIDTLVYSISHTSYLYVLCRHAVVFKFEQIPLCIPFMSHSSCMKLLNVV
jgi:hypothetical protein